MEKKKDKLKKVVKKKNLPTIKKNTKLVIKEGAQISKNLNVKWTKFKKSDKLLDKINYLFSEFNKNDLFHEISKVNKIKLGRFKTIIETIQKRKNWLNKNENFKKLEDAILKVNFIKKFNEKNNWIPVTPDYTEGQKNRYNGRKLSVQEFNEILNPDGPWKVLKRNPASHQKSEIVYFINEKTLEVVVLSHSLIDDELWSD